jgi:hypothetical protein
MDKAHIIARYFVLFACNGMVLSKDIRNKDHEGK